MPLLSQASSEKMSSNRPMSAYLNQAIEIARLSSLDPRLEGLVEAGLEECEGVIVFRRNLQRNIHLLKPDDPTDSEAAINEVPLDYYFQGPDWAIKCVSQGILLAREVLAASRRLTAATVETVIAVNKGGSDHLPSSTFRFYCLRAGDRWLADDIELYDEAILTIQS